MSGRIGVCSWSLRPRDAQELARDVRAAGLDAVQLALDPLRTGAWAIDATVHELAAAGVDVLSGMMGTGHEDYSSLAAIARTGGFGPDEHWEESRAIARADAELAARLGLSLVTFHAGFLPKPGDARRGVMIERLGAVADAFAEHGVDVGLETGQEDAETLLGFLRELERPGVGVNFDPANMILYGMGDPVEALRELAPHVRQVHVKDALPTDVPGTWGAEVPAGEGAVDWRAFFGVLGARSVDLVIEREAGERRLADVRAARELVERLRG